MGDSDVVAASSGTAAARQHQQTGAGVWCSMLACIYINASFIMTDFHKIFAYSYFPAASDKRTLWYAPFAIHSPFMPFPQFCHNVVCCCNTWRGVLPSALQTTARWTGMRHLFTPTTAMSGGSSSRSSDRAIGRLTGLEATLTRSPTSSRSSETHWGGLRKCE